MHALKEKQIPYVLAGSIRDDGPLPGVLTDVLPPKTPCGP